ncbi:MAG TPA: oligosaccharide flippase family protein, partial [Anaerolineae bacterium]|nr:oligosaccharide flippase family protein [Anaerolineae bacterium]
MEDNKAPQADEVQPARPSNLYWSILFTGGGTGITIVSLFLETMIAVRLLDKDSYGIYVLLLAAVNLLVIVVDFGCKTAIPQLMSGSDRPRQAALVNSVLIFRLGVMILTAALIWLSQDLLFWLDPSLQPVAQYIAYIPMMLAAISIDELFFGILQGFHAYKHIAVAQILRSLLRLILTAILLLVFNLGLAALVYSWIISFTVAIGYQYFAAPIPKRPTFQYPVLKEVLRFGFPIHLTRFLATMGGRVDKLLLGALAGPAST